MSSFGLSQSLSVLTGWIILHFSIDQMIDHADNKAQDTAYEKAQGMSQGVIITYVNQNQFCHADQRKEQPVYSKWLITIFKADDDAYNGKQKGRNAYYIIGGVYGA